VSFRLLVSFQPSHAETQPFSFLFSFPPTAGKVVKEKGSSPSLFHHHQAAAPFFPFFPSPPLPSHQRRDGLKIFTGRLAAVPLPFRLFFLLFFFNNYCIPPLPLFSPFFFDILIPAALSSKIEERGVVTSPPRWLTPFLFRCPAGFLKPGLPFLLFLSFRNRLVT